MALVVADRVWETTSTSGTGTLTLSGAVSGYQTFAVIGNGNTTYYTITNGTDWEVGIGTYTSSGTTLSRDTVLSSSLGGTTKITVTPGSFVFVDYPASKAVYEDESGNVTGYPISGGTINGTTIGATTPSTVNATTITGQTEVLKGTGTNLFLRSSDLTNAAWTASNVTVTGSQTDPFGGTTASLLNDGTATGAHILYQYVTLSAQQYTYSLYAKAGTANFIGIYQGSSGQGAFFNLTTGAFTGNIVSPPISYASTNVGNGWWRVSIVTLPTAGSAQMIINMSEDGINFSFTGTSKTVFVSAPQLEVGNILNAYIPTTTTAVYGTPTLSFSGVSTIGLESNGALFLQPAGTGALQAQATTSTTAGGNARGSYAVDLQMQRGGATKVASATNSFVGGGYDNVVSGGYGSIIGGYSNTASGTASNAAGQSNTASGTFGSVLGGYSNTASGYDAVVVNGYSNTAAGYFNFIGTGYTNSANSGSAVTTQATTTVTSGSTAVTLSGSNANIKVGQLITGTGIGIPNYVAAISGTSLTLAINATGSGSPTLSFFTPHGVVVGGGNNQATGSYSFIGGGGDAGTASNRNVASGLYSAVVGGRNNTASGVGSFVGGGGVFSDTLANLYPNTANGIASSILGGLSNTASQAYSSVLGGYGNTANGIGSTALGIQATTRSISGNFSYSSCDGSVAFALGVAQTSILTLGRQTTDATATALTSNNSAASTTNQVILPNNSAYYFKGSCIANVTGAANGAAWSFEGAIMRGANAASTVLIDTPSVNRVAASSGATAWTIALTADTTNGGLTVTVTGVASTTIRWVAKVETTEVTF